MLVSNIYILSDSVVNNMDILMITKIQRFFRKYRCGWDKYDNSVNAIKKKKELVRIYINTYPEKYLYDYPHFLANKLGRQDLMEWLRSNKIVTRRDVQTFMSLESVTESDIFYTGW